MLKRLLCSMTFLLLTVSASHAFEGMMRSTFTATITFMGNGSITFNAVVKNRSDNQANGQITWDLAKITLGSTRWLASEQYIEITNNITCANAGIQIYTDNCAADASPQFFNVNPTSMNPCGLVREDNKKDVLPLCWRLTPSTTDSMTIVEGPGGAGANSQGLYSNELGGASSLYRCFLFMKDKKTPNIPDVYTTVFANGEDYVTLWDSVKKAQIAEGTFANFRNGCIYIGANFAEAVTPATYKTSTMRIEAFME